MSTSQCFSEQTHTMQALVGTAFAVTSAGKGNRIKVVARDDADKGSCHQTLVSHDQTACGR